MQRTTLSNPSSQVAEKKAPLRRSRPTPQDNGRHEEDTARIHEAINAAFAYIEFDSDGHVLSANDLFLDCMGYELEEIAGKHHRQFVEAGYASSNDYAKFWDDLRRGVPQRGEFHRLAKGGRDVWLIASYTAVKDRDGVVEKVIKLAHDVTEQKLKNADFEGQIEAIGKAQAVIEFNLDGTIITANDNFLNVLGYTLGEVQGQHHRMFVEESFRASVEYRQFWEALSRGEYQAGEYKRIGKGGKEVWIQASYNPIFDLNGKPFKVVKYATDVTEQKLKNADVQGQIEAVGKAQAVIEFNLDGTIITANDNFLNALGYTLGEVQGQHHRLFVEESFRASVEYRQFWEALNRGEYQAGEYKRIGKGGKEVWIQASYNPILDLNGKPFKVVKYATDVTEQKLRNADFEGQIEAVGKARAVIEFNLDGTIITANDNFLNALGYTLGEVQGQHHRMFVEESFRASVEYRQFWEALNRGEYQAGEYKRIGKGGKEVWIQASYNPILDLNGKPFKVVKYATDVTEQKLRNADVQGQIEAVGKAQAVIEFNLDGTIITANDNFLNVMGYTLAEIQGQHHRMFAEESFRNSIEYRQFWEALNRGEYQAGEYKRIGKGGKEVWIQASYNPILDLNGKPLKVVKYATDVTEQKLRNVDFGGQIEAVGKAQAVIEFNLDGTIITANDNFLNALGYTLGEVQGQHHRMFAEESFRNSIEYRQFWEALNRGEYQAGEYKRIGKGGKEVWIQASYNPILDLNGKPLKVVKYATDVTEQKLRNVDFEGQIEAVGKAQAVIEFNLDGTIITANDNFLNALGYTLGEVQGQHHRMFVEESFGASVEYRQFWEALNRGEYQAGEYKRIGKGGKEVWIQASYNPILDLNGNPLKVVKYATDVTAQKLRNVDFEGQIEAVGKAQAVIEFNLDGTIITANDNFLNALGYTLGEVQGQHHRMFAEESFRNSIEYRQFWEALNRGEYQAGEYKRIGKGGKEVWIQASYNPILDLNGKPLKVVKYATDVTAQKLQQQELRDKVDIMLGVVGQAMKGDLTVQIPVKGEDAIGQMGEGLQGFLTNLRETLRRFADNAQQLGSSSEELTVVSQQMASNAEETSTQAGVVSAASEQVTKNVQVVATGTEEMSASIREIAKSSNEAARVAKQAVGVAESANSTINELGDSSVEIGKVIKVITSIAQQTNLLALNATIEAARAGEAGKGFAVVANEVKELAKQTAQATEDISQKIEAIQAGSKGAVDAIGEVSTIINQINDISNTIASAVEEQTATTNEIGRNVGEAARGSGEIAENISGVASAADSTTQGASDTLKASQALSEMAGQLQELVSRFTL